MVLDSWSNWNLEMLIFADGGKPENPRRKTVEARERTNKQLDSYMTLSPGIEPAPQCHASYNKGENIFCISKFI
jgi:hypothetical protein